MFAKKIDYNYLFIYFFSIHFIKLIFIKSKYFVNMTFRKYFLKEIK